MGSAAETNEPTTGVEKHHQPVKVEDREEEEDEQVFELERKTSSFPHGKGLYSADNSTITTSSSSSFSGDVTDVIPDFHNGEGENHIGTENLEVPETPEKETGNEFHEEHDNENNCNVYFDEEQGIWKCRHCDWTYREGSLLCFEPTGSDSAGAEPDVHESQTVDHLNVETKQSETENVSFSEDKEVSTEIEEVKDGDLLKELDVVDKPTGDVIEEGLEIEDYDVEKVLDNQETHDLFCPNCNSCITKRVILKKRKRNVPHVLEDPKRLRGPLIEPLLHSEDNLPTAEGGEKPTHESFVFKCLSCFNIFIPTGVSSKPLPPKESVEGLSTQQNRQEEASGNSNWFSSIFGFNKRVPAVQQGGSMPTVPQANPPRDNLGLSGKDTTGSNAINPSKSPALVQGDTASFIKAPVLVQGNAATSTKSPVLVQGDAATSIEYGSEISASEDKQPVDTPMIQDANSHGTSNINNGATVEDGQKFLVPLAEVQTQETIDKTDSSPVDENHTSDNGHLSPIEPFHNMSISNKVTRGPDGVTVETVFHTEDPSHLFEGTHTSDTIKPDFGQSIVTGVTDTDNRGVIIDTPSHGIDILPVSSLEEGTLTEPLLRPAVEGRKLEILKSIVYGGLIESITSLGVISSAAGSGASMLSILVLGLANLFGGLILIFHNLQELREEEPIRTTTEDNQTNVQEVEGRYKRLLGRRENFTLHATVAILSFIIVGLLPPVVYYFSFSKTHNKDYKVASVLGSSLLCIVLLAIAKAHVKTPRGSYLKSVMYYAMIAVSVSGISYMVGEFLDQLLEKYGWSDGSETPVGHMMLSLMGRKAGGFGYSVTY